LYINFLSSAHFSARDNGPGHIQQQQQQQQQHQRRRNDGRRRTGPPPPQPQGSPRRGQFECEPGRLAVGLPQPHRPPRGGFSRQPRGPPPLPPPRDGFPSGLAGPGGFSDDRRFNEPPRHHAGGYAAGHSPHAYADRSYDAPPPFPFAPHRTRPASHAGPFFFSLDDASPLCRRRA